MPSYSLPVKNLPAMWETWVRSLVEDQIGKIPWRREQLPTPVFWPGGFHGLYSPWGHKGSDMAEQLSLSLSSCLQASQVAQWVKNPPPMQETQADKGSVPRLGRFPEGGHGDPVQYSFLENPMDRGA